MAFYERHPRIQHQRQKKKKKASGLTFMELHVTWLIVSLFLSSSVEGSNSHDRDSLDAFLCKHAKEEIAKPRTGVVYNISPPANLTGLEVSVIRLRTASLWVRGVNYSFFNLPRWIVPQPVRKRIAILYENLGNLSSHYYNVPNYTMVAPVFGVMAYSSSETTLIDCEKMSFIILGDPITIRFPHVRPHAKNITPICAKFDDGGSVEFNNMTESYVCKARSQGHYTLVVPSAKDVTQSHSKGFNIWWVLGFVIGFVGLAMLTLVLLAVVKVAKKGIIRKMERNSERDEPFDTFWIGETKLPFASMIRTQPVLEIDEVIRC